MRFVTVTVLVTLAIGYVGAVLALQRAILFPRPEVTGAPGRPADASQVWLATEVGPTEAWYLPPRVAAERSPVLIYFHGNAELIDFLPGDFETPRGWGVGVLLVEFPGYGRSGGSPSQSSVSAAALAAFDWTLQQPQLDRARVAVYGRSLGGAAAVILAAQRRPAALVLESTFTSVRTFANRFLVPEFLVLDPFDSLSLLGAYTGSTLLLHGERDDIVPFAHGERLARAARNGTLNALSCGHNDCPKQWEEIRSFLVETSVLSR
jgi:fermentation-respiration switch protein FrsA (DUF1100 family)